MKTFLSFLIVAAFLLLPTCIVAFAPQYYSPLTEILFNLLLFLASLWFAAITTSREAEKRATDKWLPAAETACYELLTMSATIETMRSKQVGTCKSIEQVFPNISDDQLAPVTHFIKMRCEECAANYKSLKDHVDNSFLHWQVFIDNNCEESECERIHHRLAERMWQLDIGLGVSETMSQDAASQTNETHT